MAARPGAGIVLAAGALGCAILLTHARADWPYHLPWSRIAMDFAANLLPNASRILLAITVVAALVLGTMDLWNLRRPACANPPDRSEGARPGGSTRATAS